MRTRSVMLALVYWPHLDQIIDVGWVASCQAAEDDQDFSTCVPGHVPAGG